MTIRVTYPHPEPQAIRSVADMLAVVPHLLGYHPDDGLIVIATADSRLALACRVDLRCDPDDLAQLLPALQKVDTTHLILIGYGDDEVVAPAIDAGREVFGIAGLEVFDALRVFQGRYWSYLCANPDCCPAQGTPFDPATNPLALQAIVGGSSPLPDRRSVAASIDPIGGSERAAMAEATTAARRRLTDRHVALTQGRAALASAAMRYQAGQRYTDEEAAWLSILLTVQPVRDHAWATATRQRWHLTLWRDLTRRAEPDLVAAPAALLAVTAWLAGDGSLAHLALDRALSADPHYRMALLIRQALREGIPPAALSDWPADINTPSRSQTREDPS
jgi:hypothetical protein